MPKKRRTKSTYTTHDVIRPAQLLGTLNTMLEGCQIISPTWRYLYVNNAVIAQGKYKRQQLIGRTMMECYPGITKTPMFRALRKCMKQRRSASMENEFIFHDRSRGWFELKFEPVPEGVMILSQDITSRKKAEEKLSKHIQTVEQLSKDLTAQRNQLTEANAKFHAILSTIADGVISVDTSERIMFMNRTAQDILGLKKDSAIENKDIRLLSVADSVNFSDSKIQDSSYPAISEALHFGRNIKEERLVYNKSRHEWFSACLISTPIHVRKKIIGMVCTIRDITREKAIDNAKSEFVSLASHQLRTPTTAVNWLAKLLLTGHGGEISPKQEQYVREIYDSNKRMIDLVNHLLNVSRIELGTFAIQPTILDPRALCESIVKELQPTIQQKRIRIVTQYRNIPKSIRADEKILRIIFQNILSNAVTYSRNNGKITIRMQEIKKAAKTYFTFSSADSGIGIPKKQQKKIFTRLFRADNAITIEKNGTGLGLYMVKSILDQLGGTISFTSLENKGSTFTVVLPLKGIRSKAGTTTLI